MYDVLFLTLALITLASAVSMIFFTQPIFAALSFIVTLISLAGIYALLGSSFLFAIQIIIYAGAIVSLILFIIMFLNIKPKNLPQEPFKVRLILLSTLLVAPFAYLLIDILNTLDYNIATHDAQFGTLKSVGESLFACYVLPFEMVSILLLAALIGAVVLANKEGIEDGPTKESDHA